MGNLIVGLPLFVVAVLVLAQLMQSLDTPLLTSNNDTPLTSKVDLLLLPIDNLTHSVQESECRRVKTHKNDHEQLLMVEDSVLAANERNRQIAQVVHVTAKSRCLLKQFSDNLQLWKNLPNHSFYLHNDGAIDSLLEDKWVASTWPALKYALHCVNTAAGKTDIWRAIILYGYGGIYTDFDNAPADGFHNGSAIAAVDQAYFVIEAEGYLSQYFMAAMPGHPLLKLYVDHCISRLLAVQDVESQYVPYITGPGALKNAMAQFVGSDQLPNGKVRAGVYTGIKYPEWTVRVAGKRTKSNEIIKRNGIYKKRNLYKYMNMTHFSQTDKVEDRNETCLHRIHRKFNLRLDLMGNIL